MQTPEEWSHYLSILEMVASILLLLATFSILFFRPALSDVPYPGSEWTTTLFLDDFSGSNGSLPDSASWIFDTGTQYPGGPAQWGTGEIETYSADPSFVHQTGDGHLAITPQLVNGQWTSARIETQQMDFKAPRHGKLRVEAAISAPAVSGSDGLGYWPAFWLLGAGVRTGRRTWPAGGEFDIMEMVNGVSTDGHGMHCGVNPGGPCNEPTGIYSFNDCPGSSCWGNFHTYALVIDRSTSPESLEFMIDNQVSFSISEDDVGESTWRQAVHHGHFVVANVAMGGAMPNSVSGTETPGADTEPGKSMLIDYIAVWTTGSSSAVDGFGGGWPGWV